MTDTALALLAERVRALVPLAGSRHDDPGAITAEPGSYLLLIGLGGPLALSLRGKALELPAGSYVYAGSARGPGGLRARLGRHLARGGRPHWHIDHVTARAAALSGLAYVGANECELRRMLSASGLFTVPAPGFGSSDCRECPAHLLRYSDGRYSKGAG